MLLPLPQAPSQALDRAFRRQKPTRDQLDAYDQARAALLAAINPLESEEHLKTHLRDFLAHPGVLGPAHYLNVSKRRDMVARLGPRETDPVGLLIEVKKFANPGEMVSPDDLNRKALHELLLYYLQDRADHSADDLRRLIITNGYEWFLFDAADFDRLFWRNAAFVKDFRAWQAGQKAGTTTDFFYKDIARPFLAALDAELKFTYLDLRDDAASEQARIHRHKLFSPAHLLKLPFAQDANTLNRAFYEELLYLIGLEEVKDKGRKLIRRCAPERRHPGALLENTIAILDSTDQLSNLTPPELAPYGAGPAAQTEAVALELCLTWINRLLFLKLLEGQLRRYHAPNPPALTAPYRFLTPELLPDYDTLNRVFFQVLNKPAADRRPEIQAAYGHLPYLNSSLYEISWLEQKTIQISNLYSPPTLPLHRKSVLPAPAAAPAPQALAYLLRFLDAYDFASEGDEQVQETNKSLISAAVLGLIFEKLNGYQDGSFYTPGFITMYMARHTLGRAVLQHFNRHYGFGATSLVGLANCLDGNRRPEYSAHFNALTVLDPAVGSGHFLVSALNELLALKADLGLLLDDDGRRLPYRLSVARDELAVENEAGDFVPYHARLDAATGRRTVSHEHTRLQRALFREKRHLMEHALFGVDLNPNSVRICRLRLWIELLKHAYYRPETNFQELETLPNLDLNVKTGNSLLARFPLAQDLSDVFRNASFTLATYRATVHSYFNTRDRHEKQKLLAFMAQIKEQFTQVLHKKDKKREDLRRARNQRIVLETQISAFETKKERDAREFEMRRLELLANKLQADIDKYEQGALFRDAFEWRFEFPEVLTDTGEFRGFDVVIGNPPYIRADEQSLPQRKAILNSKRFQTLTEKWDLYVAFMELGYLLLKDGGIMSMIIPDAYALAKYAAPSHSFFLKHTTLLRLDFFSGFQVFEEAAVGSFIPFIKKQNPTDDNIPERQLHIGDFDTVEILPSDIQNKFDNRVFAPNSKTDQQELNGILLSEICYVSKGMVVHANEHGSQGAFGLDDLVSDQQDEIHPIPFSEGKNLERWLPAQHRWLEYNTDRAPSLFSRPTFQQLYEVPEKLIASDISSIANPLKVSYDNQQLFHNHSAWSFVPWHMLRGVRNRSIQKSTRYVDEKVRTDLPARETLEITSQQFSVKYLLAVMNSEIAREFLTNIRRSKLHLYPDDWKQLPIPIATPEQQAPIIALVEQVLAAKAAGQPTAALEADIDALVAARYGLTPAETKLLR